MYYPDLVFYPTIFSFIAIPVGAVALVALSEILRLTTRRIVWGAIFALLFIMEYFLFTRLGQILFVETYIFIAPVAVFLPVYFTPRFAQLKSELVRVLACFVLVCMASLYIFFFLFQPRGGSYVFLLYPVIVLVLDILLASGIYHVMLVWNILPVKSEKIS
jgi:hypothetical protein